jgi:hypothetical protein
MRATPRPSADKFKRRIESLYTWTVIARAPRTTCCAPEGTALPSTRLPLVSSWSTVTEGALEALCTIPAAPAPNQPNRDPNAGPSFARPSPVLHPSFARLRVICLTDTQAGAPSSCYAARLASDHAYTVRPVTGAQTLTWAPTQAARTARRDEPSDLTTIGRRQQCVAAAGTGR